MGGLALALLAAASFGTADFLGGFASRRAAVLTVTLVGQAAGFAVVLPLLFLRPAPVDGASLAWGALGGAIGCVGLLAFFRALAGGVMSTAAPVTAVVAAGVPVLAGVLLGERPALQAWLGVGAGLLAVGVIGGSGGRAGAGDIRPARALALALIAGLAFGLFFVALSRAPASGGFWPLLGARVSSVSLLVVLQLAGRREWRIGGDAAPPAALSGMLDMTANALFLLALRQEQLVLVAVLVSLYPAATVILALGVLRERLRAPQVAGVGLALLAVGLISSS
ncbi:MAG TPA: EamA family transporter [Candidatus Dormibacteraeota bacterium]